MLLFNLVDGHCEEVGKGGQCTVPNGRVMDVELVYYLLDQGAVP